MDKRLELITAYLGESVAAMGLVVKSCAPQILIVADEIGAACFRGNKVMLCGNGGSAADCQHMASELVSGLSRESNVPGLPAIALTTDTSLLTARANDHGFEEVFERQVQALGRPGDVLIAISTSGHSENVRRAVRFARENGIRTIGLVGQGGPLAGDVDIAIVIPDHNTQHIQESLLPVEHAVCLLVEQAAKERLALRDQP